jgi:Tol biopolymer transport system component
MNKLFIGFISLLSITVAAQTPGSDVYIANLTVKNTLLQVSNVTALTNRPGYDNQPFFLADGDTLLVTSEIVKQGQQQTDSFLYRLADKKHKNITNT